MEFGEQVLALGIVEFAAVEHGELGDAARKAADLGAPVAEHDAAGAVAVDQRIEYAIPRRGIHFAGQQFAEFRVLAEARDEFAAFVIRQGFAVVQLAGNFGQRRIAVGLGDVTREVVVAGRVEQAQPGEMTAASQLLGGGGQKNQTCRACGQGLDQSIFRAGRFGRPGQVMRFIDDEQIPACFDGLGRTLLRPAEEADAGDHELLVLERIASRVAGLDRFAAFFVEQRKL